jgi:hypothetical protein
MNEKLGEVLSHALPNPRELLRPERFGSMQGYPQPLYAEASSLMPQNPHLQPSFMQPNQLRGHQMKMGQVDQMHLNPYNTMQDLVDVCNAQQEILPAHPQGHARTNQLSQQPSQMGGSAIKMEEGDPELQNMELQQVLAETQHVILKQLNQINSHSRHLFPQGLPANKEDGGDARAQPDMPDPKATAERRREGFLQRNPSQPPMTRQLSTNSPHATR